MGRRVALTRVPAAARIAGLAFCLLLILLLAPRAIQAQEEPDYREQARQMIEQMTVAERVGQLFLVTFEGDQMATTSPIFELVRDYHVGGVALLSENGNITGYGIPEDSIQQVRELTNVLQQLAITGFFVQEQEAESDDPPPTVLPITPNTPIPLFVATSHLGDSLPVDNATAGFTPLPSNMAVGAAWDPEYARVVGHIAGADLAASGVNLLLGPSLDVLENPNPDSAGDLGTRSFGGDPYWVGQIGRSYVAGVHEGGGDRLALAATSFPGKGSSDRPVEDEVPTVRRSLEQLRQIELAPFFAVVRDPLGAETTADALLATHIRFQGFQGNIRATTAPISLDPQALNSLMTLPEFAPWRAAGGLVVSDALGARSVERFYDDTEREFPHRQVAKDALLAGNDLLYVQSFALGDGHFEAEAANVRDTINWFRERYVTEPSFQTRVDDALLRILELKLRQHGGDFSYENVVATDEEPDTSGSAPGTASFVDLAQSAVTLLAPSPSELSSRLPTAPALNDRIVIFTDQASLASCPNCSGFAELSRTAIEERVVALYGPDGSGQVTPENVVSFTFEDLNDYLAAGGEPIPPPPTPTITPTIAITTTLEPTDIPDETPTPVPSPTIPADFLVQEALADADWLVFAMMNGGPNAVSRHADALSRFLEQRPDLASRSEVIVLAFDAPYFLDSTEISKLSAYYGIYSRVPAFVDSAVRALFLESPLTGAPPVSVPGIRYDLFEQTRPDPLQVIELFIVIDDAISSPSSQAPLQAAIGDTLILQTGAVRDKNGNPVPDGTLVRFVLHDRVQGTVTIIGDRPTASGVAQLDYVLDARMGPGQFRITAESGDALLSQEVDIVIAEDAQLAIIIPTTQPTPTPTATPTETPTPEPTPTETPAPPTATPEPPLPPEEPGVRIAFAQLQSLFTLLGGVLAVGIVGVLVNRNQPGSALSFRLGRILWGLAGGLILFNYVALGLPGSSYLSGAGTLGGVVAILAGGIAGLALYPLVKPR